MYSFMIILKSSLCKSCNIIKIIYSMQRKKSFYKTQTEIIMIIMIRVCQAIFVFPCSFIVKINHQKNIFRRNNVKRNLVIKSTTTTNFKMCSLFLDFWVSLPSDRQQSLASCTSYKCYLTSSLSVCSVGVFTISNNFSCHLARSCLHSGVPLPSLLSKMTWPIRASSVRCCNTVSQVRNKNFFKCFILITIMTVEKYFGRWKKKTK